MRTTKLSVWIVVGLAGLISCKMKGDGAAARRGLALEMAEGVSAQAVMAAKPEATEKADAKPAEVKATWKRSQIVPNSSRVMVGDREELALRSMQTHVTIDGFRARVVIDYLYANERDRQLEGTFQLRLPEDASPYYFAFGETSYEASTVIARETAPTVRWAGFPVRAMLRSE